jgi:mxaJ protein
VRNVELVLIPLKSEPGVRFDYDIAMGVRYGEPEWKQTVETLITENRAAITGILREYNVPLVDERGELVP